MPIAPNCHGLNCAKIPWLAADAARMPSRKAPLTLTTTVPQGNVSPTRRATKPDSQNLAVPPSTLPRATHMAPLIVSTACLDQLQVPDGSNLKPERFQLSSTTNTSSRQRAPLMARTIDGLRTTPLLIPDFALRWGRR